MNKRAARGRFWHSLHFKALVMLLGTIFVACVLTFFVMFFLLRDKFTQAGKDTLLSLSQQVRELSARSNLTPEEIAELGVSGPGTIKVIDSPKLRDVTLEPTPSPWEDQALVFGVYQDYFPVAVMRLQEKYLLLLPTSYDMNFAAARMVVVHTLLLCSGIAVLCTLVTLNKAIQPLKKLNAAIAKAGQGNLEVRVDYKGKDEIGKIVENFNWMAQELHSIEYLRKDFVSSVSHEFKTPIAAIAGSAKLLASIPREKLSDAKLKKYTGMILEETARMSELSTNLLRLSRLESQSAMENKMEFSLDEQIRRCILQLENLWSAKGIDLDIQLDPVTFSGDEELLAQVWMNLLSNAFKFTDPGGSVIVALREMENRKVKIRITDNGCGMTKETQLRMFEKFYQGDPSRPKEGHGLGLSIVKRILDLHHGQIWYSSVPGEGTECTVILKQNRKAQEDPPA